MSNSEHPHIHPEMEGKEHSYTHLHPHTQTKVVLNRLARAIGHLQTVSNSKEYGRTW